MPYPECSGRCAVCNRRVRNQAESFVQRLLLDNGADPYQQVFQIHDKEQLEQFRKTIGLCGICLLAAENEGKRIIERYKTLGQEFGYCVYVHMLNRAVKQMDACARRQNKCKCTAGEKLDYMRKMNQIGEAREDVQA